MANKKISSSLLAFAMVFSQLNTTFVNVHAEETNDDVDVNEVQEEQVTDASNNEEIVVDEPEEIEEKPVEIQEEVTTNKTAEEQKESETITASYDQAISEVTNPKWDDGVKTDVPVSADLKAKLDTTDLSAKVDAEAKTITLEIQLKDVYLSSDYLNGKSAAGESYYNMVNFFTDVKQVQQLLNDGREDYTVIDNTGASVDKAYVDELHGLIDQIIQFDTSANLKYDRESIFDTDTFKADERVGGTDVIATSKEGNVSFKFHIDSHGWWGYDLGAHDSITGLVMGLSPEEAYEKQHEYTMKYGNFFVIEMENKGPGKLYMLNGTDLENPMIYVSEDGKEAFMIDVDFYGANVLNSVIKSVIGDECESLKIFLTHNHGDHVNNLAVIAQDEYLKDITTIIWPENEPHSVLSERDGTVEELFGKDLVTIFGDVVTVKDMEKFNVAGNTFQFIEIPDEHTPAGGQLADLTNKILYSGDTLGAQIHLGGTTVGLAGLDSWMDGISKSVQYIENNEMAYIIGGHTPYLNTTDFASWILTALNYAKDQLEADPTWNGGLVVVENGKIVSQDRLGEMFGEGLTDREELNVASVNFRNNITPEQPEQPEQPENPDHPTDIDTGDHTNILPIALSGMAALALGVSLAYKKKKETLE